MMLNDQQVIHSFRQMINFKFENNNNNTITIVMTITLLTTIEFQELLESREECKRIYSENAQSFPLSIISFQYHHVPY